MSNTYSLNVKCLTSLFRLLTEDMTNNDCEEIPKVSSTDWSDEKTDIKPTNDPDGGKISSATDSSFGDSDEKNDNQVYEGRGEDSKSDKEPESDANPPVDLGPSVSEHELQISASGSARTTPSGSYT